MISIKLKGSDTVKNIDAMVYTKDQMSSLVKIIQDDITKNLTNERIVTEDIGGSYGTPKPLSRRYLQWKISHGKPRNIFQKEKKLIDSVKNKKKNDFNYIVYIGGKPDEYGKDVNRVRKFFGISSNIIRQIEEKFKDLKIA